jgi:hypothetical protein
VKLLEWLESKLIEEDHGYETPCLVWQGALGGHGGYGIATWVVAGQRITRMAHVVYYEVTIGPIAEGLELDHLCKFRPCVRHTEAVTHEENMLRARKAVCSNGHTRTEENTYYHPRTGIVHGCKDCRREAVRRTHRR